MPGLVEGTAARKAVGCLSLSLVLHLLLLPLCAAFATVFDHICRSLTDCDVSAADMFIVRSPSSLSL